MKCSFCGHDYNEDQSVCACKGCPVAKGCGLMKCPNCGYETPAEPKWLKSLTERRDRDPKK
jgi:hypothetical protein